jgi:hypothetical protein
MWVPFVTVSTSRLASLKGGQVIPSWISTFPIADDARITAGLAVHSITCPANGLFIGSCQLP